MCAMLCHPGMRCGSCVSRVKSILEGEPSVVQVSFCELRVASALSNCRMSVLSVSMLFAFSAATRVQRYKAQPVLGLPLHSVCCCEP